MSTTPRTAQNGAGAKSREARSSILMYFVCAVNFLRMIEVSGIIPGSELRTAQVFNVATSIHSGESVPHDSLAFSGLVVGVYAIGRLLSLPLYVYLTRRDVVSRTPYLMMTMFSLSGNLLYMFATAPWQLVFARAVKGMAASIDYPNKMAMSSLFAGSERSQAFMLAESATMAGLAMGPLLASILACIPHPMTDASSLICVFSIIANLVLALIILFWFPHSLPIMTTQPVEPSLQVTTMPLSHRQRARGVAAVVGIGFLRNLTRLGFEAGFCSVMTADFGFGLVSAGFVLAAIVATGAPANVFCRFLVPSCHGKGSQFDDTQLLHATEPMALLACFWLLDAQWPGRCRVLAFLFGSLCLYPLNTVSAGICSSMLTKLSVSETHWHNGFREPGWWFARERLVLFDTTLAVSAGQLCGPWLVRAVLASSGVTQDILALVCMCAVGLQILIVWAGFGHWNRPHQRVDQCMSQHRME